MTIVSETYDDEFEQPRETIQDNLVGCRIRLTAVTNAAHALLRVVDDLVVDIDGPIRECTTDYGVDLEKIRANLRTALRVANGGKEKLSPELFDNVTHRSVIRAAEGSGLL